MFSCLCCCPERADDYQALSDKPKEESSDKPKDESSDMPKEVPVVSEEPSTSHLASEQKIASDEEPKKVEKPSEATVTEDLGNSQSAEKESDKPLSAEPENDKVEPSNAKVPSKASDKEDVAPESKAEVKTEEDQKNKSTEIEENKMAENNDDVPNILDEAIKKNTGVNPQEEKSGKDQQNIKNDVQAPAPKELDVTSEKRPVVESIKLNNISRAVVEKAKKGELKNV